ncbi:MAG TPA: NAD(P)-dependent oxidoreductase [Burkholderiales bacterium]|nr:NAD(P)-dependent oxidoreductase [Burkholderiales bacterium]
MSARHDVVIVIPGDDPPQIQGSPHLERLREYGEVRLHTHRPATAEEKIARVRDAVCLVNTRGAIKWPREALAALPRLRMATVCGIGTDAFDLAAARERGVIVCNIPGKTAPIVAEHAFGLMLAAAKRAYFQTAELKAGRWTRMDNVYLCGKTLGVIGTGAIGGAMARLGRAIGMDVVAWTFSPTPARAAELGVRYVPLDELLRTADVLSVHVRLTPDSRGLLGPREIGLMKPGAILVNTARGPVVDTDALIGALRAGRLAGAALDVFDTEPLPPGHPLLACEQIILTPHNADQTPEGMDLLNAGVVDNVIAFLQGRPQNVVV